MIDAYAAVSAYVEHVPELEQRITEAYLEACGSQPEFDSFKSLLGRGYPATESWIRQIAWASQHLLGARSLCVGNQIIVKRGRGYESPLIDQLGLLGWEAGDSRVSDVLAEEFERSGATRRLDAMVVNQRQSIVYLVKGYQFQSAIDKGRSIDDLPLFSGDPSTEGGLRLAVPRGVIRSVAYAHDIVKAAYADIEVVPVILAMDDIYGGLRQALVDVSPLIMRSQVDEAKKSSARRAISLGGCPVIDQPFMASFRLPDRVRFLPKWPVSDQLNLLPVDRACRCLMLLSILWKRQRLTPDKLVSMRAVALGRDVGKTYKVAYPDDLRRHDLEDCLERSGLIERPAFEGNSFALTPRGVARVLLSRRLLVGQSDLESSDDLRRHVLHHIHAHAELWAKYRRGSSSVIQ